MARHFPKLLVGSPSEWLVARNLANVYMMRVASAGWGRWPLTTSGGRDAEPVRPGRRDRRAADRDDTGRSGGGAERRDGERPQPEGHRADYRGHPRPSVLAVSLRPRAARLHREGVLHRRDGLQRRHPGTERDEQREAEGLRALRDAHPRLPPDRPEEVQRNDDRGVEQHLDRDGRTRRVDLGPP